MNEGPLFDPCVMIEWNGDLYFIECTGTDDGGRYYNLKPDGRRFARTKKVHETTLRQEGATLAGKTAVAR